MAMPDPYALQDEVYKLQGELEQIPLQPVADEARQLAKEFAALLEAEAELAEAERERAFMAEKSAVIGQVAADKLGKLSDAYKNAADAGDVWKGRLEKVGGIFQAAFRGDIGGALGGAFGWMAERGKTKDGKDAPVTLTNAIGSVGGAVVAGFSAIAGAARSLVGSLLGLAQSASPAFGAAFGEVMEYLMSSIGLTLIPMLAPLLASILMYSDTIADVARRLALVVIDIVEGVYDIVRGLKNFNIVGSAASMATLGLADLIAGTPGSEPDDANKMFEEIRENLKKQGEGTGEKMDFREAFRLITDSMKVNQGGRPQFESVTSAYARITQSEAGASDLRKKNLENQRKIIEYMEKMLASMYKRTGGDANGEGGTTELGADGPAA